MAIAQLLGSALRLHSYRQAVSEWLPPSERHKEVKGKRGWEKADTNSSPSRQGGWVARQLISLIQKKDVKVSAAHLHLVVLLTVRLKLQEAVLSALAALSKDNSFVAVKILKATPDQTREWPRCRGGV